MDVLAISPPQWRMNEVTPPEENDVCRKMPNRVHDDVL
jgi:hypothetical protein